MRAQTSDPKPKVALTSAVRGKELNGPLRCDPKTGTGLNLSQTPLLSLLFVRL
jgi:hypothetical protein